MQGSAALPLAALETAEAALQVLLSQRAGAVAIPHALRLLALLLHLSHATDAAACQLPGLHSQIMQH